MRTFQRISRLIRPAIGLPVLAALAILGLMENPLKRSH